METDKASSEPFLSFLIDDGFGDTLKYNQLELLELNYISHFLNKKIISAEVYIHVVK